MQRAPGRMREWLQPSRRRRMDRRPDLAQITQTFSTPHPSFSRGIRSILFRNAKLDNRRGTWTYADPRRRPPGASWCHLEPDYAGTHTDILVELISTVLQ